MNRKVFLSGNRQCTFEIFGQHWQNKKYKSAQKPNVKEKKEKINTIIAEPSESRKKSKYQRYQAS